MPEKDTMKSKPVGRPKTARSADGVIRNARFTQAEWRDVEAAAELTGEAPAAMMRNATLAYARRMTKTKGAPGGAGR